MEPSSTKADVALRASSQPDTNAVTATEVIAAVVSFIWLVGVGLFFVFIPMSEDGAEIVDSLRFVITLMAIFFPVAMIWIAALSMRSARVVRDEARRLQSAIDGMRQTYVADRQARGAGGGESSVERKLNEIARATQKTETALATFSSIRQQGLAPLTVKAAQQAPADDQTSFALGTTAEDIAPPISRPDLVRALNFPESPI